MSTDTAAHPYPVNDVPMSAGESAVAVAITASMDEDRIVTIPWTQEVEDILSSDAEGSHDGSRSIPRVSEYWGDGWRVHLDHDA